MSYIKCEICQEAYFLHEEALVRHQQVCLAVKAFTRGLQTAQPVTETPQRAHKRKLPATSKIGKQRKTQRCDAVNDGVALPTSNRSSAVEFAVASTSVLPTSAISPTMEIAVEPPFSSPTTSDSLREDVPPTLEWRLKKGLASARDYLIVNPKQHYTDLAPFLEAALKVVHTILRDELNISNSLKYNIVCEAMYDHPQEMIEEFNFKTQSKTIFTGIDNLAEELEKDADKLLLEESQLQSKNSGWSMVAPTKLTLRVSRFTYKSPSGKSHLDLPKRLEKRKATVNVRNLDDKCFKYCMLVKHLPSIDAILYEDSFKDLEHVYNFKGLKFPLKVSHIAKFEKMNPGTSVNVFECDTTCEISPLRIVEENKDHTDLLLYKNGKGDGHFVYISNFSKLIRPQITKIKNDITVCKRCSTYKTTRQCKPDAKTWLQEHLRLCTTHTPTAVTLPKEGENILKFNQVETQIPVPIYVVADFEATLLPVVGSDRSYQEHIANSFCTLVQTNYSKELLDEVNISTEPFVLINENAGQQFLLHLADLAKKVETLYTRNTPLKPMTADENERHARTTACELCERLFNDINIIKCVDHDHVTGNYRASICGQCNLRCQQPNYIPVFLHNGSKYDFQIIMKSLSALPKCEVRVIPSTTEQYISIAIRVGKIWLRFLDSYRFMSDSLSKLTSILSETDFIESAKLVPPEHVELIRRKSVYPYEHVKSVDVFNETNLPAQEEFYDHLNNEPITSEDYDFALSVWSKLNMKSFRDYHIFYLKLDVCLLSDVISSFRKTCLEAYKIDCCHHYTAPGLAYKAMLRMTRVELELLTCSEQMLMVEAGVRGGIVQSSLRHARANNAYLKCPTDYRSEEPTSYLLFLDCVGLYGFSMTQPLPTGNFKWVDPGMACWSNLPLDAPHGFILEVDVEYPDSTHDNLKDLPPLPRMEIPPGGKNAKLLATLNKKHHYVVHYTMLQQAVKLGVKVTKVHRVLSFSQSPFIKTFVETNARMRAETSNPFYKNVFKLIVNSTFGRLLYNKRSQVDVRIVTTDHALQKLYRQTRFIEHVIISEHVVAVHLRRKTVMLDAPIYAGMCVLDISKRHMYHFFYDILREHFKPPECKTTLTYADTDSLLVFLETEKDLYEVLKKPSLAQHLDQSNYPSGHPLKNDVNKGRTGCFKDEAKDGLQIQEVVCLRSKMYSFRYSSQEEDAKKSTMKAKGVKTAYVRKHLHFDRYKETLLSGTPPENATFNLIKSKTFRLTSVTIVKKSLSADDDKRQILENGVNTLPYGHYSLREIVATSAEEDSIDQTTQ